MTSAEYNKLHKWLIRNQPKIGVCFYCGSIGKTEWSNIDHAYRPEPTEYQEVCRECHSMYDRTVLGVIRGRGSRIGNAYADKSYAPFPPVHREGVPRRRKIIFRDRARPWVCPFCLFGLYSKAHKEDCPKATITELLELRQLVPR